MRNDWSLDAVATVAAQLDLGAEHRTALREILGLQAGPEKTVSVDLPSRDNLQNDHASPGSAAVQSAPEDDDVEEECHGETGVPEAPATPRIARLYQVSKNVQEPSPDWLALPDDAPAMSSAPRDKLLPLIPHQRMRAVLGATLKVIPRPGEIDIDRLIQDITAGRAMVDLPRKISLEFSQNLLLIRDFSSALAPFRLDVIGLANDLTGLVGAELMSRIDCEGWPPDVGAPPQPGAVALVVSGFGMLPGHPTEVSADSRDWAAFGKKLASLGWTPVALTPAEPTTWPKHLTDAFGVVHWAESTNARQVRGAILGQSPRYDSRTKDQQTEDLAAIARTAALSARLDHKSLRRIRRFVTGVRSPMLESEFWWNDQHIESRGETAITMQAERLHEHRAALRAMPPERQLATAAHFAGTWQERPSELVFEEEIIQLLTFQQPGWIDDLIGVLRHATATLHAGAQKSGVNRDFALWILAILPELDLPDPVLKDAGALYHVAAQVAGARRTPRAAPGQLPVPSWLTPTLQSDGPVYAAGLSWAGSTVSADFVRQIEALPIDPIELGSLAGRATCFAISKDGSRMIVGSKGGEIAFYQDGDRLTGVHLKGHVSEVRLSHRGWQFAGVISGQLLTGSVDKAKDRQVNLVEHEFIATEISDAAFSKDSKQLTVSTSLGITGFGPVRKIDLRPPFATRAMPPEDVAVLSLDGLHIAHATGGATPQVWIRNTRVDSTGYVLDSFDSAVRHMVFSPDDSLLAILCVDGSIAICDVAQGAREHRRFFHTPGSEISAIAFTSNSRLLVAGDLNGALTFIDPIAGRAVADQVNLGQRIYRLSVSGDGKTIYALQAEQIVPVSLKMSDALLSSIEDYSRKRAVHGLVWPHADNFLPITSNEDWLRVRPDGAEGRVKAVQPGKDGIDLGEASWLDIDVPQQGLYRFEDAIAADRRPPLVIDVLAHPSHWDELISPSGFLTQMEDAICRHAGLPDGTAVIQRRFQNRRWDRDENEIVPSGEGFDDWANERLRAGYGSPKTWLEARTDALTMATGSIVFATQELMDEGPLMTSVNELDDHFAVMRTQRVLLLTDADQGFCDQLDRILSRNRIELNYPVDMGTLQGVDVDDALEGQLGACDAVLIVRVRFTGQTQPEYYQNVVRYLRDADGFPMFVADMSGDKDPEAPTEFLSQNAEEYSLGPSNYFLFQSDGQINDPNTVQRLADFLVNQAHRPSHRRRRGLVACVAASEKIADAMASDGPRFCRNLDIEDWFTPTDIDDIAREFSNDWRRQTIVRSDFNTSRSTLPDSVDFAISCNRILKDLALRFHNDDFRQRYRLNDASVAVRRLGLSEGPIPEGSTEPIGVQTFVYVWKACEYFHDGFVEPFLTNETDPAEPVQLTDIMERVDDIFRENSVSVDGLLEDFQQAFSRFGTTPDWAEFTRLIGRPDEILSELTAFDLSGDPEIDNLATEYPLLHAIQSLGTERFASILQPFTSPLMRLAADAPGTCAYPITLAAETGRINGLLTSYTRKLAEARATNTTTIPDGLWYETAEPILREFYPSLFSLPMEAWPSDGKNRRTDAIEVPIGIYADMVAFFSEIVTRSVRMQDRLLYEGSPSV